MRILLAVLSATVLSACSFQGKPDATPTYNLDPGPPGSHSYTGPARPDSFCARLPYERLGLGKPNGIVEHVDDHGLNSRCEPVYWDVIDGKRVPKPEQILVMVDAHLDKMAGGQRLTASVDFPELSVPGASRAAWVFDAKNRTYHAEVEAAELYLKVDVLTFRGAGIVTADFAPLLEEFLRGTMDELRRFQKQTF